MGIILGILIVDRVGRRKMLIQSTIQSLVAQLVLAIVFAVSTDSSTVAIGPIPARASIILVRNLPGKTCMAWQNSVLRLCMLHPCVVP